MKTKCFGGFSYQELVAYSVKGNLTRLDFLVTSERNIIYFSIKIYIYLNLIYEIPIHRLFDKKIWQFYMN